MGRSDGRATCSTQEEKGRKDIPPIPTAGARLAVGVGHGIYVKQR